MADNMRVTNLADATNGSRYRVAFDLMQKIAEYEYGYGSGGPDKPREYYLDLYRECINAVS